MDNRVQLLNKDANRLAAIMLKLPFSGVGGMFASELSGLPEISKTMTLAINLCTNVKTIKQLQEDLRTGTVSAHQALSGIITDWIKKNKKGARLDRLISAVSSNGLEFDELISSEFHCRIPKEGEGGQQVGGGEVAGSSFVSLVPGSPFNSKRLLTRNGKDCSTNANDYCGGVGAMEKALANLVIIREIFKNLDNRSIAVGISFCSWSKMKFLQVCRAWRQECLGLWRKDQLVKLFESNTFYVLEIQSPILTKTISFSERMVDESQTLPCLGEYYKAFLQQKDLSLMENKHSLVKQPFRRFSITYAVIAPLTSTSSPLMKFFWSLLAPHVTHLELKWCSIVGGDGVEAMRWLLVKGCPQLKVLRMTGCKELNCSKNIELVRDACASLAVGTVAKCIHSMHLDSENSCAFRLLDIIPNLKELAVSKSGILDFTKFYKVPCNNSPLPITKLEFELSNNWLGVHNNFDDFGFYQYCKASNNIKELTVRLIMFKDSPANFVASFFSGIAHCKELRKLDIRYNKTDHPGLGFLTPFRAMKLPNLTTFCIDGYYYGGYMNSRSVTFDLKTIAGMPNLEFLNVGVSYRYDGKIEKWVAIEAEPAHQIMFEGMQNVDSTEWTGSANLKSLYFNSRYRSYKPSQAEVEEICQWGVNLERINGYSVRELRSGDDGPGNGNDGGII